MILGSNFVSTRCFEYQSSVELLPLFFDQRCPNIITGFLLYLIFYIILITTLFSWTLCNVCVKKLSYVLYISFPLDQYGWETFVERFTKEEVIPIGNGLIYQEVNVHVISLTVSSYPSKDDYYQSQKFDVFWNSLSTYLWVNGQLNRLTWLTVHLPLWHRDVGL